MLRTGYNAVACGSCVGCIQCATAGIGYCVLRTRYNAVACGSCVGCIQRATAGKCSLMLQCVQYRDRIGHMGHLHTTTAAPKGYGMICHCNFCVDWRGEMVFQHIPFATGVSRLMLRCAVIGMGFCAGVGCCNRVVTADIIRGMCGKIDKSVENRAVWLNNISRAVFAMPLVGG